MISQGHSRHLIICFFEKGGRGLIGADVADEISKFSLLDKPKNTFFMIK